MRRTFLATSCFVACASGLGQSPSSSDTHGLQDRPFRSQSQQEISTDSLYELHATDIHGEDFDLGVFNNTVTLVVNVATYWGTTKDNYEMMARLQANYANRTDFAMLLFPCNQFLDQEPHANSVVEQFAATYLNLTASTVKMFAKSDVNGPCSSKESDPCAPDSEKCCPANNDIYSYLQNIVPGKCSWNFNKYVVGRDGKPYDKRWGDEDLDSALTPVIDQLLAEAW